MAKHGQSQYTYPLLSPQPPPPHALARIQAWFCAYELGRLSGHFFDEHCMRKLEPDQYRTVQLLRYGKYEETTMVSESGAYTLLAETKAGRKVKTGQRFSVRKLSGRA